MRHDDVARLEARLGVRLPADYRDFLLARGLHLWARLDGLWRDADRIVAATLEMRADLAAGVFPVSAVPEDALCIGHDGIATWTLLTTGPRGAARVHVVDVDESSGALERGTTWRRYRTVAKSTPLWAHLLRWHERRQARRATYVVALPDAPWRSPLEPIDERAWRELVARDPELAASEQIEALNPFTGEPMRVATPGRTLFRTPEEDWELEFRHGRLTFRTGPSEAVAAKMREVAAALDARFVPTA